MIRCLFCAAVLAALLSPHPQAQNKAKPAAAAVESAFAPFTHFSATMSGGLIKDEPRKIYRSGNLFRVDLDGVYHVTDLATSTTWFIHPDSCTRVWRSDVHSYPSPPIATTRLSGSRARTKRASTATHAKLKTSPLPRKKATSK